MSTTDKWKTKTLLVGTAVGALIGLGTAYLLWRTAEESGSGPPQISTGDAIKSAIGVVGLMRGIAALGDRG
ncbi:MAG TPA: hypothetical protein VK879_04460 [Candidatus Sulfomarinibacteraceae bacterium]|nr:hypothetical protein [Candidatus Sulfomarinibacteraceae bacterium]